MKQLSPAHSRAESKSEMKIFVLPITLLLLAGSSGCDIFQTRDPQSPTQSNSTFNPPINAEIVLSNLQYAIQEDNTDNYIRCFSVTPSRPYDFIASQEARANYPGLFNQWSLESERRYFQNLGTPANGAPSLIFSNQQTLTVSSDSVIYNMNYQLFFPHRRSNVPHLVQGNMQLYLGTDDQHRWAIYRWQDLKTSSDSTWSYWKAIFSGS